MSFPHQNAYHVNSGSPMYMSQQAPQQMIFMSRTSTPQVQQVRFNRSTIEEQQKSKVQQRQPKVRESSEQKKPKIETVLNVVQNKSQLVYGSGNFNFHKPIQVKSPTDATAFKDMNIRIQDVGNNIIHEDSNELMRNSTLLQNRSRSPNKKDSNKEWNEILLKTKSIEENLLQLKTSINNNLKKIQRYKEQPDKTKPQRSENSIIKEDLSRSRIGSPVEQGLKHFTKIKSSQQDLDQPSRLSKESTQSKYSTQSQTKVSNEDRKKEKIKQISSGLSHNPSLTSLNSVHSQTRPMQSERLQGSQHNKELHLNTDSNNNIVKVQALSRIHSPLQSKITSKDNSQHHSGSKARNFSREKNQETNSQSQIFSKSVSNFKQYSNLTFMYLPVSPLKDRIIKGQFIGRGKFSDVYLAKDAFTGFNFALKIIRKEVINEFQMEEQLAREIKIQSFLSHPNIVKLYGTFYDDEKIYLVLEFCADGELFQHQYKQPDRRFDEASAALMVEQILQAINYMHDNLVMHRDLKTENILLSYGQIKLCDLGCVCDMNQETKTRTTFCGTVDYIAPEVITGGATEDDQNMRGYDQRCDNWQIGVLAFELVAGQTPFTDKGPRNEEKIMNNILQRDVKFPETMSNELKNFVKAALQKDPEKRSSIKRMLHHPWIQNKKNGQFFDINAVLNK